MSKNKLDLLTFEEFKNFLPKTFSYSFSFWPYSQRSALVKPKLAQVIDGDKIHCRYFLAFIYFC